MMAAMAPGDPVTAIAIAALIASCLALWVSVLALRAARARPNLDDLPSDEVRQYAVERKKFETL
jgi:hypothetical protein